jgi:3-dehydroquinate dehydratase / shikimate dehydrogenase
MGPFGRGLRQICAVAAAPSAREMIVQVRKGLHETPTVELRLDWLRSDGEREKLLQWVATNRSENTTFIATCRRKPGGGRFSGSVEAELGWLARAQEAGCTWCDLEIETQRELRGKSTLRRALPKVLLSLHDFKRTPPLGRAANANPKRRGDGLSIAALKIAANARTIGDSTRLLRLARPANDRVIVPMGEIGLPARILALHAGSALAYAPVSTATAPGQVSLVDFKYLYRAHQLGEQTQVFGVIGNPIGHSLSPLLHNTGFASGEIDAVYLPFFVKNLRDFLAALPEFGVRGFSVTLPYKRTILRHLNGCDPLAADIGAVNTVTVRGDGSLYGCNTDYVGVLRALERRLSLNRSRVLIFGAGGSARAAAFALARAGASVGICARREKATRELARAVGGEAVSRRALRTESFDAILNSTPVGMHPHDGISPLASNELHCRIVMDLIYRPERTRLLQLASRKGIATVSGVEMFLAQGIAQWEIWTKRCAPEAAMRNAVLSALRREEKQRSSRKRRGR